MMFFDNPELTNRIITRNDEKFVEEILCDPSFGYKKSLIAKHKQVIPAIFKAMDALAIESIQFRDFVCLKIIILEEMRTNKKVESYDQCADIYLYMVQVWGYYKLESGILKSVPKSEREQAAKEFEEMKSFEI